MSLKKVIWNMDSFMQRHMSSSGHQHVFVGAIILIVFPLFYWMWKDVYPQFHEYESFSLRLSGSLMGLGLMSTPLWPLNMRRLVPWYWFMTLLYAFTFLFTYFFLMNQADDVSSMALLGSVFLLVLLVDLSALLWLLGLGVGCAFFAYYLTAPEFYVSQEHIEVGLLALFFGIASSTVHYKAVVVQKQRLKGMAATAGMIAHELRTPLLSIASGAQALNQSLPILFDTYLQAERNGLSVPSMRRSRFQQLRGVNDRIINEVNYANTIIDMLLMKADKDKALYHYPLEQCSMAVCLQEAVERYPFRSDTLKALVTWRGDFEFVGSKILMEHVLFNLLKNALHVITSMGRGHITIWTDSCDKYNYLYVKDTAKGMSAKELSRLFDHFYTTTFMGTGIGLSFCKMVMDKFGGNIYCEAEEGLYTKFTLIFPCV